LNSTYHSCAILIGGNLHRIATQVTMASLPAQHFFVPPTHSKGSYGKYTARPGPHRLGQGQPRPAPRLQPASHRPAPSPARHTRTRPVRAPGPSGPARTVQRHAPTARTGVAGSIRLHPQVVPDSPSPHHAQGPTSPRPGSGLTC
jgi:hypothetical protein